MKIEKIPADQWAHVSQKTHEICFGVSRPPSLDRIDYALVALDDAKVVGYVTVREHSSEQAYLQFGGILPDERGRKTLERFARTIHWLRETGKYKRLTLSIGNEHVPMLKLALLTGFRVVGVRTFHSAVLLEHLLDFEKGI